MYEIFVNNKSEDVIIAVPALGERKEMFKPLADKMESYMWLVFDLPGSNKEESNDYSISTFCNYIEKIIKINNVEKAHFIGSSLGAWIIQAFANKYPEYVKSLVLLDGGHYFLGDRGDKFEEVELLSSVEDFEEIRVAIQELTFSMPNLESESYQYFEQYFLDNYIKQGDFYTHHYNNVAYNHLSREISFVDFCLKETPIPIHLLIAEASADDFSIQKSDLFKKKYINSRVSKIKNGQHYLSLTNTREVSDVLNAYYKKIKNFTPEL